MSSKKTQIGEVRSDINGYSALAALYNELKDCIFETIEIDFSDCPWFDANMCAPLGAVLATVIDNFNEISIVRTKLSVRKILMKNRFLESFGYDAIRDTFRTTITYQRFANNEEKAFAEYLASKVHRDEFPRMSTALAERFRVSLLEIFVNASIHAESTVGIFACGQFFPKKHYIDFSVADAGLGIRRKIHKELGWRLNSDQAIEWALQEGHTTRRGNVPGGLGLKLIREFINLNKGRMQIVSDRGFWECSPAGETLERMELGFPGTVINIEINTSDTASYRLSNEG